MVFSVPNKMVKFELLYIYATKSLKLSNVRLFTEETMKKENLKKETTITIMMCSEKLILKNLQPQEMSYKFLKNFIYFF